MGESDGCSGRAGSMRLMRTGSIESLVPGHPVTIPSQERKAAKGCCPWRNARVKLCPDERYPQPSAPIKKHGFVQAG